MDKPLVGIILVGYQDYANRFLKECWESLEKQSYPAEFFQVYLVDNCPLENGKYVKENFPRIHYLSRSDGNYTAANNLGAQQAIKDGCEYLVMANMDTVFDRYWLEELVKAIEKKEEVGIAQSKVLLYPRSSAEKKEPIVNSWGNRLHFLGFGYTEGYKEKDREISGFPEIGYASGCSFIISQKTFWQIKGYDEEYWMYHDDVEISWKVKLLGLKIVLAPRSVVFHKYEFSRSIRMVYYMERNRYLAMFHFYKGKTILLLIPAMLIMEGGMLVFSVIGGWLGAKLKADFYFCRPDVWKRIRAKRKFVAKIRKVSDRQITKDFSGKVLFQEIDNPLLKYIGNPFLNFYWKIVKLFIFW